MCGRYMMTSPAEAMRQAFGVETRLNLASRYNIAPTQAVPIVRLGGEDEWPERDGSRRALTMAQWGLVPSWMKELPQSNPQSSPMINARIETVAEKPSFRGAFKYRRCLVPANGFYEWQRAGGGGKQPYLIHLTGHETESGELPLFAFAGLWEMWTGPDGNSALESVTLITMPANHALSIIHDRMPLIIKPQDYGLWLGEERHHLPKDFADQMHLFGDEDFTYRPISKRVNHVANDDADIVALIDDDAPMAGETKKVKPAPAPVADKAVPMGNRTGGDDEPQGNLF